MFFLQYAHQTSFLMFSVKQLFLFKHVTGTRELMVENVSMITSQQLVLALSMASLLLKQES